VFRILPHWKNYRKRLLEDPRVAGFSTRFAPQVAFVRARLSPEEYLGLHLTLGAIALVVASWLFGIIAKDVATNDALTVVDVRLASWFHAHATPTLTKTMLFVTHLGDTAVVICLTLLFALFLLWRRQRYWLLTLALTVPCGMLLNMLLKLAFARARPSFNDSLVLTTFSFPSGHTMAATVFFGTVATFLVWSIRGLGRRVLTVLVASLLIALVAFSRIYLGVHYLSDVLAAIAAGLAWLALCLTGVDTLRRRRFHFRRQRLSVP
jgi:membrane-associated phospholipid phosphatase